MNTVEVRTQAPDFRLTSASGAEVSLSALRGSPVVLVFYPADWSPICSDQLALYNELKSEFERLRAVVLAISVDGRWCHAAFAEQRHLHFQLLADFEPKGAVTQAYGVYRLPEGIAERALFVLDERGTVVWKHVAELSVNPGADGILRALENLRGTGP